MKWIGAVLILLSCGGFGFYLSSAHKRDARLLTQLAGALDYMECELQYRLTPLPDLCRQAGEQCEGELREIMNQLAVELESQIAPDVACCMDFVLNRTGPLPERILRNLRRFGSSMGRFDLDGQVQGLENLRHYCREDLKHLQQLRISNARSYQTLGLCAGAALVILFI